MGEGQGVRAADAGELGPAPDNLAALIVLLPHAETDFSQCTPAQFDERVEGFASQLFHVFRWATSLPSTPGRQAGAEGIDLPSPVLGRGAGGEGGFASGLRALVLRPAADAHDAAADFDAGAAFLKSLQLETVNAKLKWLTLPEAWTAEQWAATVMQELECSGKVGVRYSQSRERIAKVAHPLAAEPIAPLALGPDDVALVSGGGKGITFELALELARQTGCKLALLGSSPPPVANACARRK